MIFTLMKNIRPETPETKVSFLDAAPKPRLVQLRIAPSSEEAFTTSGAPHRAMHYVVKVRLKAPQAWRHRCWGSSRRTPHIWILDGEALSFVKAEGPLAPGDPILRIESATPVWPRSAQ